MEQSKSKPTGIIIGGGIGGLTTALALQQKGINVRVFEQAPTIEAVGAGIWMAPNAMKIFEKLGVAKLISESGQALYDIQVRTTKGKLLSRIDGEKIKQKHGFVTIATKRSAVHEILMNAIENGTISTNKKCINYTEKAGGVEVEFSDGTSESADFVIFADGLHSLGRKRLSTSDSLRYSGQTSWRFLVDFALPNPREMLEIWAPQSGLRVGYSMINAKEVYVYITVATEEGGKDELASVKENLIQLCQVFGEPIYALINTVEPEKIIRSDISDFAPIKTWFKGNVLLLGDAAHATTPNLGQGACQAIEDAWCLANLFSTDKTIEQIFEAFQKKRMKKTQYITNTSCRLGKMVNTSGLSRKIIEFMLANSPDSYLEKQLDLVYSVEL